MWMFWIAAGVMAAAAAALVFMRAAATRADADAPTADPALAVYRRQLGELDALAARGVLGEEELKAAQAEAGRRLLSVADVHRRAERPGGGSSRLLVLVSVVAAASAALGVYLQLGSPGLKDEPYAARLAAWRAADPSRLGPAQMAALLRSLTEKRPNDAQLYDYLGRAKLAAGDSFGAVQAFRKACRLAPRRADLQAMLGIALSAGAGDPPPPEAKAAFQQALVLDPSNGPARYYLGRAAIAAGQVRQGLAMWRTLAAGLALDDGRRAALLAEIDAVQAHGDGAPPSPAGPSPTTQPAGIPLAQLAFIRAMVAKQAADLRAHPQDAQGWARLIRSYGVLGDRTAQAQALAKARTLFASRPDILAQIQAQGADDGAVAKR